MSALPGPVRHPQRVGAARPPGGVDIAPGGDRTIELLSAGDPSVRWQVMRDLLGRPEDQVAVERIPPRSPQANAFAQRWVRTLRHELLDRTIIWNERQLRALLVDYIEHYNEHRPHRGIDQRAPNDTGDVVTIRPGQRIKRHTVCGGLINEYRAAA